MTRLKRAHISILCSLPSRPPQTTPPQSTGRKNHDLLRRRHTYAALCRLSNLFNALPRQSGLRLPVYKTLLELASANDEIDILGIDQTEVDKWLSEWDISSEEKSAFLKLIVDAFQKADQP